MSLSNRNEIGLVDRVARGDGEAFATLFDRHSATVLGMLIQLLKRRELAEEILQETFMQAWSQADRYRWDRATVCGWLLMLARSRAVDHLRSSRARGRREDRLSADPASISVEQPVGTDNLETVERQRQVLNALAALGEDQRRCLELSFFEGLSHSQIAERLDQPLGTVKSRILSGMRKLRPALAPLHQS
jgi:RNA polymerase sigma-70 factor (ECF subfamily)